MLERIQFLNEAGRVERFHTSPGLKPETDAAHSWYVAMLCKLLTEPNTPSPNLLVAALAHDMGELFAGDIPSPSKRAMHMSDVFEHHEASTRTKFGFYIYITAEEQRILTLADNLAGMLYCCRERALGNLNVVLIADRWLGYIGQLEFRTTAEQEVMAAVGAVWNSLRNDCPPSFDIYQGENNAKS